jgi:hypothetical protein
LLRVKPTEQHPGRDSHSVSQAGPELRTRNSPNKPSHSILAFGSRFGDSGGGRPLGGHLLGMDKHEVDDWAQASVRCRSEAYFEDEEESSDTREATSKSFTDEAAASVDSPKFRQTPPREDDYEENFPPLSSGRRRDLRWNENGSEDLQVRDTQKTIGLEEL